MRKTAKRFYGSIVFFSVFTMAFSAYALDGFDSNAVDGFGGSITQTAPAQDTLDDSRGAAPSPGAGAEQTRVVGGLAGLPVVDDAGTAFIVSHSISSINTVILNSNTVSSALSAITPAGQKTTLTLGGISSAPVITGPSLVATASLPDTDEFRVIQDLGGAQENERSVLYRVSLPLSATARPEAVVLEGAFASAPRVEDNRIYVVTSDSISLLNGSGPLAQALGNVTFNQGQGNSFLYIFDNNFRLLSKTSLT